MEMDILVILIMAFGLFAILMFILFYIYAKKHYNDKHMSSDLEFIDDIDDDKDLPQEKEEVIEVIDEPKNTTMGENTFDLDTDFIPKKKKV